MAEQITTAAELDTLLAAAGEMAEPVVVREGFRVWTLTEDDIGQWWAWSWREEGEEWLPAHAETLRLPLTVLHRPDSPAPSDGARLVEQVERLSAAVEAVRAELDRVDARPGPDGERKVHTVVVRQAIASALDGETKEDDRG